jgi:hypothetical protein
MLAGMSNYEIESWFRVVFYGGSLVVIGATVLSQIVLWLS